MGMVIISKPATTEYLDNFDRIFRQRCPQCGSEDCSRAHQEATLAVPECDYWICMDCLHQWGHE